MSVRSKNRLTQCCDQLRVPCATRGTATEYRRAGTRTRRGQFGCRTGVDHHEAHRGRKRNKSPVGATTEFFVVLSRGLVAVPDGSQGFIGALALQLEKAGSTPPSKCACRCSNRRPRGRCTSSGSYRRNAGDRRLGGDHASPFGQLVRIQVESRRRSMVDPDSDGAFGLPHRQHILPANFPVRLG